MRPLIVMRSQTLPRPAALPVILVAAGLLSLATPQAWTQKGGSKGGPKNGAPSEQPASPLFPDAAAPEAAPAPAPRASLRGLLEALQSRDTKTAAPMIWQLLATMSKAREQEVGPSEFLAAGYRAERLKGSAAAAVQNCLLSAWAGAQSQALFTPENIALMERGVPPLATRGVDRGLPVYLYTQNLPAVTVMTKSTALKAIAVAAPPAEPAPLPAAEPAAPLQTIVVKTLEVHLHDRVALDAYGLRNMDFRLDSVNPQGSVSFLFEDRTARHVEAVDRLDSLNRMARGMGFSDGVSRMIAFSAEGIPDTKIRGVKLLTLPFATVYLDEDIGVQLSFRLVIRVASEALMLDQLPPERRKLYEIHSPP